MSNVASERAPDVQISAGMESAPAAGQAVHDFFNNMLLVALEMFVWI
jgi:hypothetical protein